jgi:hypothetical protein
LEPGRYHAPRPDSTGLDAGGTLSKNDPMKTRHLLLSCALLAACDEHGGAGDDADYFYSCDEAPPGVSVYATDESLRAILDKETAGEVRSVEAEAATLMSPAAGGTLSASAPPTFVLTAPMARLAPATPLPPSRPPRRPLWRRVLTSLAPVGTAWAHCPGVTGDNFLFRLARPGDATAAYTAVVSVTSFTPRAEAWKRALAGRAGQTLTLTLIRAGLTGGRVTSGPFQSTQTVTFTVGS